MVAKIATDQGKASVSTGLSPHAICVVASGEEAAFLAPLPITALWGVGPKMAEQLVAMGLLTIGDIAQVPAQELMRRFGRHGYALSQHSRGIDQRELVTEREAKSISSETTFVQDVEEWDDRYLQETFHIPDGRHTEEALVFAVEGRGILIVDAVTGTCLTTLSHAACFHLMQLFVFLSQAKPFGMSRRSNPSKPNCTDSAKSAEGIAPCTACRYR
jgi:hypothetical protein